MFLENRPLMLGIDIGGSHITGCFIDLNNQCALAESRVRSHIDTHGSADEILRNWVATIKEIISDKKTDNIKIGIAMPGPFDYENGISLIKGMNKYESLYKVDILAHLVRNLGIPREQILFRNDAEAFLHGEAHCGAAKDYNKAIGITLGTGLGSAIHENGQTADANLGISAFKNGIAEDYLSTRWFVKRYSELTSVTVKDARTVLEAVPTDPAAVAVVNEFIENLSEFLYSFIIKENPQVVVVGGNIAKGHLLFMDALNAKLVNLGCSVPVKVTSLWEDAAMIGAACYWKSSVFED